MPSALRLPVPRNRVHHRPHRGIFPRRRGDNLRTRPSPVKTFYRIFDNICSLNLSENFVMKVTFATICPLNQVICRFA